MVSGENLRSGCPVPCLAGLYRAKTRSRALSWYFVQPLGCSPILAEALDGLANRSLADAVAEAEELAWMRRCPHCGFCRASRWTGSRVSSEIAGRPVVFG